MLAQRINVNKRGPERGGKWLALVQTLSLMGFRFNGADAAFEVDRED